MSINLTSIVTILDYEITVRKCLTEMLFPPQNIRPDSEGVKFADNFLREKREIVSHSMLPNAKKEELLNV